MKAYNVAALFISVALIIFLVIFGLNPDGFRTVLENRESLAEGSEWVEKTYSIQGLTEYIDEHPEFVSLASMVVGHPDSTLMFRADTPRTMGMTAGVLVSLAYEDLFFRDAEDPNRKIRWEDTGRYQLPGINESNHREAARYGRRNGLIDSNGELTLDSALNLMIRYNDPALFDYLLLNLPEQEMARIYSTAGLQHTDVPLPFSGLYLALAPSIQKGPAEELLGQWQNSGPAQFRQEVLNQTDRFVSGTERDGWLEVLERNRLGLTFMQERDILTLFPKTTAREMAEFLSQIRSGSLFPNEVSRNLLNRMRWQLEDASLSRNFTDYGSWYDNRVGLLNGVDFGTSHYTEDTTVQAVFFDQLHIAVWFHMSSNHMHQDFQQRLIWDPALIETMMKIRQENGTTEP
ncbi:MAG: hypothetical protein WD355_01365 [Balneolaceae bacterium]